MLNLLDNYKGKVTVNGIEYESLGDAMEALKDVKGIITVDLNTSPTGQLLKPTNGIQPADSTPIYQIKVRQYMTKAATMDFDFHDKWNNGIPMPMRVMVGRKLEETRGLVRMELWGEITERITPACMKCGKRLTNPVSQYFGIGSECGGHNYTNPFADDTELAAAVQATQEQLRNITWTGWIFKSAIEEEKVIRNEHTEI